MFQPAQPMLAKLDINIGVKNKKSQLVSHRQTSDDRAGKFKHVLARLNYVGQTRHYNPCAMWSKIKYNYNKRPCNNKRPCLTCSTCSTVWSFWSFGIFFTFFHFRQKAIKTQTLQCIIFLTISELKFQRHDPVK